MAKCLGNGKDHCCYIKAEECRYLIRDYTDEDGHFRKWACGLRAELGDWDKVLTDPRYKKNIEGSWAPGINCRDWPDMWPEGKPGCNICGSAM
jgi:hypothetical protein